MHAEPPTMGGRGLVSGTKWTTHVAAADCAVNSPVAASISAAVRAIRRWVRRDVPRVRRSRSSAQVVAPSTRARAS